MEDCTTWSISPLLLVCTLLLLVAAVLLSLLHHGHGRKNRETTNSNKAGRLPPGPPLLVFLAKFLVLRQPIYQLEPLLRELHARYGPVISLCLFGTLVLVSDRHLAHRVLVQGGATFADRPPHGEPDLLFTSDSRIITSSPYGPYWRLVRRNLANEALSRCRAGLFSPTRKWTCDGLVSNLLRLRAARGGVSSEAVTLRPFVLRAMFELLVHMCFGARLSHDALDEIEKLQFHILVSTTSFPIFYFFPAVTKKIFRKRWAADVAVRRRLDEVFLPLIHATRNADDTPCYADSLLRLRLRVTDESDRPLTDGEMVSLCSEFLSGGTETTVTLVEWIMAELVNHPDIQAKLREGVGAKPELTDGDLETMPYLREIVLEGLRLHPPGHFVLPHGVLSNAEIAGYTVPRGAEVNFMAADISRDETVWTAPREFRPERFLDDREGCGIDITGTKEIKMMPFGAGRRMCPGYSIGMRNTQYFVATMVKELEWWPPVDGKDVDMTEALDLIVFMKHPLRARIIPTS